MLKHPYTHILCLLLVVSIAGTAFRFHGFTADIATLLLESANDTQKAKLHAGFDSEKRFDWSYLPPYSVPRGGLPLKEMTADQKDLVGQLLGVSLSEAGYNKIKLIMSLEDVLAELEGNPGRDPEMYFVSIFGDPQGKAPWAWQLDGHHVSLHFTVVGSEVSYTPRFLGSNPGEVKGGPQKGLRVLNREEDLGFELLASLTEPQKKAAIIGSKTFGGDIVTKNSVEVKPLDAAGIAYAALTGAQRKVLWAIIDEYLRVMPDSESARRRSEIVKEGQDAIRFGWAGSETPGAPHYYRVQGPTFLIEFDNSQNNANHIHSVWRDFEGDFGRDLIKEHYKNTPHDN